MSTKIAGIVGFVAGLAVAAIVVVSMQNRLDGHKLTGINPDVPYAVLLNGGQAYFGKIKDPGNDYLILTEVYYVQTRVNPETKESTNILVKRGKEVHEPSEMIVNTNSVQYIEPVGIRAACYAIRSS